MATRKTSRGNPPYKNLADMERARAISRSIDRANAVADAAAAARANPTADERNAPARAMRRGTGTTTGTGSGTGTRTGTSKGRSGAFERIVKQGSTRIRQAATDAQDFFTHLIDIQAGRVKADEREGGIDLGRKAFQRHLRDQPGLASSPEKYNNFKRRVAYKKYKHGKTHFEMHHIGKLFMYSYDPKWKRELKYYDRLPLMLLMQFNATHFLGLNLHYLPPLARARLLDAIVDNELKDRRFDDKNKSRVPFSYQIMKRAAKSPLYKPCVKQYLFKGPGGPMGRGVMTQFLQIPGEDWQHVLFLPWERFVKADKHTVWRDSLTKR